MKEFGGVFYPENERHMVQWVKDNGVLMRGRLTYQARKQEAAYAMCKKLGRTRVAVDVGAHAGTWAMHMVHEFQHVHAFEPVAEHRECFLKNLEGATNYTLHDCALGTKAGQVVMQLDASNTGSTSVDPKASDGEKIPLFPLDSFDLQDVDFLKIDTEGFELAVLGGAAETINRCRPVVIVEQKRDHATKYGFPMRGAIEFLRNRGYTLSADLGGDFLMVPA